MALSMTEVNSDLNIFENSSYRTKGAAVTVKNSIRGGGTVFAALWGRVQSVQQPQTQGIPKSYLCGKWKILLFNRRKLWYTFPIIL